MIPVGTYDRASGCDLYLTTAALEKKRGRHALVRRGCFLIMVDCDFAACLDYTTEMRIQIDVTERGCHDRRAVFFRHRFPCAYAKYLMESFRILIICLVFIPHTDEGHCIRILFFRAVIHIENAGRNRFVVSFFFYGKWGYVLFPGGCVCQGVLFFHTILYHGGCLAGLP